MKIDACLDCGGTWNYNTEECDLEPMPNKNKTLR